MTDDAFKLILKHLTEQHDQLRRDVHAEFVDLKQELRYFKRTHEAKVERIDTDLGELKELRWRLAGLVLGTFVAVQFVWGLVKDWLDVQR